MRKKRYLPQKYMSGERGGGGGGRGFGKGMFLFETERLPYVIFRVSGIFYFLDLKKATLFLGEQGEEGGGN